MQNYFSKRNERGIAPVYLEYDYHSLFTNPKISILRLDYFKRLTVVTEKLFQISNEPIR